VRYVPCWGDSTGILSWLNIAETALPSCLERRRQPSIIEASAKRARHIWSFVKAAATLLSWIIQAGVWEHGWRMMKLNKVFLLLLAVPLSSFSKDSFTNEQAVDLLITNADEIAIVARMGANCAESIDGGFFNTAWERCSRFTPAFTDVYENNKAAFEYSFNEHDGGISSFCSQSEDLRAVCADAGVMFDSYQKAMRASELGAFDN